ncbi:DNA-formamidopyrimidine glycosylase family protein [Kitasatospora sp. GAS204B]|uniref:DNA-formamidopyrimidine glycosylase family protein n=1 Tax=unclassified Kitasatospora TaxID=2633591 RepID=UPI002475B55E|nr:DNA-formamidopyrimidine glycosylase family protein [Kitasatospora sp. GAS204B]MDH6117802.1 endonuclease-8 [Kitasatospora sp. GAS204B]
MPEGDSVFRTAAQLHQALAGHRLTTAELRVPAHATADLTGRQVYEVVPRGKHLLTRLEGGLTLHTHLRMDGRWQLYPAGERWTGGPAHQIRAVLGTTTQTAVGYRLPVVELLRTADEAEAVGHLGPDLLGADWTADSAGEAVRRLSAAPERPTGEAMLDQRNLAGIGNVYANELCFMAGVTPWTPFGELPAPERLVALAHRLLYANRLRPGHVTTGEPRPDRSHWVYGRAGRPCRRCGARVRTARQGVEPQQRVAFWCPSCQRGPSPADG